MIENIKYSLIGKEDIALKASSTDKTFTITLPDGAVVTLTKISLDDLIAYANVDLNGNQILKLLLEVLTANPTSPATGRIWYISNVVRYGDGTNAVRELVDLSATQTLTNKTLTSPRIGTAILDTNGNELATLVATASAVNQLDIRNAATGNDVIVAVTGDDTNIDLDIQSKGSGVVLVNGVPIATFPSGSVQGDILYFDGTKWTRTTFTAVQGDVLYYNGTTWTRLAPGTSGQFLQTQGAAANPLWAFGLRAGTAETITAVWTLTTPLISGAAPDTPVANRLYTDSIIKVWVRFDGTGTPAITDDLNVTSLTDNGVGDYTVTFATAMANATYAVNITAQLTATKFPTGMISDVTAPAVGSVRVKLVDADGVAQDFDKICVTVIGDQ